MISSELQSGLLRFSVYQEQEVAPEVEEGCGGHLLLLLAEHRYEALLEELVPRLLPPTPGTSLAEQVSQLFTREEPELPGQLQLLGVSCLQLFVQVNWACLDLNNKISHLLPYTAQTDDDGLADAQSIVVEDGDGVVSVARQLPLLALAKLLLLHPSTPSSPLAVLWKLRCCLTIQDVLEEKSMLLHSSITRLIESVKDVLESETPPDEGEVSLRCQLCLEIVRFHQAFHDVRETVRWTEAAAKCAGLKVKDTGALGRRTKYQDRDIAQFTLDIEVDKSTTGRTRPSPANQDWRHFPTDLQLNDDLRLNQVAFADPDRREMVAPLSSLQQCVVMARFFLKQRHLLHPSDDLTVEELLPHLNLVLEQPTCWAVHTAALLNRSRVECRYSRAVERARAQIETVLENMHSVGAETVPGRVRMKYMHGGARLPPFWQAEKDFARILVTLGSVKAALDRFLKIESWDDVIACYNHLQMRHRSAEIIRERMKSGETPRLWCQLGDATDDPQCYHTALKLSKDGKNARAFKSLGLVAYFKKEYSESIDYFLKSLDCSRFQLEILIRLAFAAMEVERWDVAAQAYRDYCSLESDNFEAWNNLAKCYIKQQKKDRALRVLHEAIRCDYDNWKVWDNLMVIATDLAVFEDTLRAYNRILDIQQTHIDAEVLAVLVKAVIGGIKDSADESSSRHRGKVAKLLARLTVAMPREPKPWQLYGQLLTAGPERSEEDVVKGCQYLQKSLAALTGQRGWDKELDKCREVLGLSREVITTILSVEPPQQRLQLATSAKLTLTSSLKLVERSQTSLASGSLVPELAELEFPATDEAVKTLLAEIDRLKSGGVV